MRSIWDRQLTKNRMVHIMIGVDVSRKKTHWYRNPSQASMARLERILPLAEDVSAGLWVFPDKVYVDRLTDKTL